jgi:hypothetical protein
MITIKNLNKLNNIELGKKNFYVARIEEQVSIDNISLTASEHQYKFELSNMKYAITVTLDRIAVELHNENCYRLYASTGIPIWLTISEIKNIDKFLDKIRLVALG